MDKAVKTVIDKLKQLAIAVNNDSARIEQVATISDGRRDYSGRSYSLSPLSGGIG
ncbi:hypothetical protein [Xanthocytophaga agilis]|uniref:Uncharacterized protein n=1 Tax=Xanthocytophaga agilis TaxID=3048010 RepID=A0AAE3UK56_9BACT|nr:hypothetical protein [Xanthocytophaga agilis]MDJ1506433.1 hypothetical protein [Xanthocytophaga agilis]